MPKEVTHWRIAEAARERLDAAAPLGRLLAAEGDAYLLGAVLPDSPFYLLRDPGHRAARLGNAYHDPAGSSFAPFRALLDHYGPLPPPAVTALLAGVVCHIRADAAFHPLIHYLSGPEKGVAPELAARSRARHRAFEGWMDLCLAGPEEVARRRVAPLRRRAGEAGARVLALLLSGSAEAAEVTLARRALRDHALVQGLLARGWFYRLARRLRGGADHAADEYLALGYPPDGRWPAALAGPLRYVEAGERAPQEATVAARWERAVAATVADFAALEEALTAGDLGRFVAGREGPNLNTGRVGVRYRAIERFAGEAEWAAVREGDRSGGKDKG